MFRGGFFSRDPGGTNAIIPIVKRITEIQDIEIYNFASSQATPLWEQSGLHFTTLPDSTNIEQIESLLSSLSLDFVFTGTSEDTSMEGYFWIAAKRQKIVSYSIIDHWTKYKERYIVNGQFLPTDYIFTIDEGAKAEMISQGFSEERVLVGGQPHFEKFYDYHSPLSLSQFCEQNHLSQKKVLLFVSDTISLSFPEISPGNPVMGFDEHSTLTAILDELCSIPNLADEFQLVVKLHPKEPPTNYSALLGGRPRDLEISIIKTANNLDLIYHADCVVGMFSMMLFEAFLMNKAVLSVQLNATDPIRFGNNKIKLIVDQKELRQALVELLNRDARPNILPQPQSPDRIINTILMNLRASEKS